MIEEEEQQRMKEIRCKFEERKERNKHMEKHISREEYEHLKKKRKDGERQRMKEIRKKEEERLQKEKEREKASKTKRRKSGGYQRQNPVVKVLTSATFIRDVFGILKKVVK